MKNNKIKSLFTKNGLSPFINLKTMNFHSREECIAELNKKLNSTKYPFLLVNLHPFKDDIQKMSFLRSCVEQVKQENPNKIFIVQKEMNEILIRSELLVKKKLNEISPVVVRSKKQLQNQYSRIRPLNQDLYLNKLKQIANGPPLKKINSKVGYESYLKKIEVYLEDKPGEEPSRIKGYLRKIVKSKYFYYYLVYKALGIIIKIGIVLYFLTKRGKTTEKKEITEKE